MLGVRPYDDHAAMAVMARLDPSDWVEAQLVRGREGFSHLSLFADWRATRPAWIAGGVVTWAHDPVALYALCRSGIAGVASAAFLARDHARHRRALAEAGARIRAGLPSLCAQAGIGRVEARSWYHHPSARRFLAALGFRPEAVMPGHGPGGVATFVLHAYLPPPAEET